MCIKSRVYCTEADDLIDEFKIFCRRWQAETRLRGSRDANELPPTPPDKLRDHLYPRVATAKIYTTELSYYSPGEKNLDGQKAEKEVGDDRREREREREREEREKRTRERRDAAQAIFSARVVKQQKIINHRDFYSAKINLIT